MDSRAKGLVDRLDRMAGERGTWEQHWREISELMRPFRDDFNVKRTPGEKRTSKIFDGTAGLAAENLAAGLWGMLTNSANVWFQLKAGDEALNDDHSVKLWMEDCERRLRSAFAAGGQRFYASAMDLLGDLVPLGTGVFYVDEMLGRGRLYFACRHLAECYVAENQWDEVDTLFRRFKMTARQAEQRWGNKLGPKMREAASKRPEQELEFLHAVMPAKDWDSKPKGGKDIVAVYVSLEDGNILGEEGYFEFPFMVPRWSRQSRSVYGDSPAMLALADTKMLNQMSRTSIVAAQKSADPPLLAPDESSRLGVRTTPGGIIYGGMDPQGRPMYQPLQTGANFNLTFEMEEQRRQAIRDSFYSTLLLMVNQPGRTATEVLALQEEKVRLMGPHLGRVQAEFLDPLIGRTFALLSRAGQIAPPPPALMEAGGSLEIEYVSPMARAQKASEAMAVARTLEVMIPLAQIDPSVADGLDGDEALKVVGEANGIPARVLRSPEAIAERRKAREQQQALMMMSEQAPKVAQAAKAGAEAQQIAAGGGKQAA